VSRRLDWDKVGREERVRRHGSVSVYDGLPRSSPASTKPWKTKTGKSYAAKLRPRFNAVLNDLEGVPPAQLPAARENAVRRLKAIAAAERARLTGPRQRKIQLPVLEREVGNAVGRARSEPKPPPRPPQPLARGKSPGRPARRNTWRLEPLKTSVRTSKAVEGQPRTPIRGTLDELGLRVYWDADERVDRWLLAVRRNGKVIRRESLRKCEWTGKVGPLHAIHALEVRLTGMAGDRMVAWSGAGLSIPHPKPSRKRPRNDARRRRGRSG
jgi:hypothetical protein